MNARTTLIPATCVAVGIAIGVVFSPPKENNSADDENTSPRRSTLRSALPVTSNKVPDEPLPPVTRESLKDLAFDDEKLLDLARRASSTTSRMLDFERASLHLSAKQLLALAKKAESLPVDYQTMKWARTNLLVRLARLDPQAALDAARAIKERDSRNETVSAVITGIGRENIGRAVAELDALKGEKLFKHASNALLDSGAEGASTAILNLLGGSDEPLSGLKFSTLGSALTSENLAEGLQLFERISSVRSKRAFLHGAVSGLVKSEPQAALDLVETFGDEYKNRIQLLSAIGKTWLASDQAGARAWIESLGDPADRAAALREIVSASPDDREWITAQISSLPEGESFTKNLFNKFAYEWGVRAPEEAVQWISELPPGQARTTLGVENGDDYARNWVSNDPEAATAWLKSLEATDPLRYNMLDAMAGTMAKTDQEAAHHWAQQIPDEEGRHRALNAVITYSVEDHFEWAAESFVSATEGLTAEQSGPFATATSQITIGWANKDPEATFEWAQTLPNESQRNRSLTETIAVWRKSDSDAAYTAVESADLDEDLRAELLQRIRPNG